MEKHERRELRHSNWFKFNAGHESRVHETRKIAWTGTLLNSAHSIYKSPASPAAGGSEERKGPFLIRDASISRQGQACSTPPDCAAHQSCRADEERCPHTAQPSRVVIELDYFKARKQFSSGVVEGLDLKAKVTMRKAYGYRTFRVLELSLYHSLAKLPEPKLAHKFF